MRYEGVSPAGVRFDLGAPVEVSLTMEEDDPAHRLSTVFDGRDDLPDLTYCNVYDDGGDLYFGGIVDSQVREISGDGILLRLTARSKAALLLDNEAMPQTYLNPSLGTLFRDHGAPYGLTGYRGKESSYYWTYVIPKGTSEWQVFWDFCVYCIGVEPRVTPDGLLDVTEQAQGEPLVFSNEGGIPYSAIARHWLPEKRLSHLYLQDKLGDGYTTHLPDLTAIRAGVQRTRYVTAANWQGRRRLKTARRQSDAVVLTCPGGFSGFLGAQATVVDKTLGTLQNYSVAGIVYTLDNEGERWTVTLRTAL